MGERKILDCRFQIADLKTREKKILDCRFQNADLKTGY
jgi:hypothetical protein